MKSQNFFGTVFKTLLYYQTYICVSTARNIAACDTNDIPQCMLCAYCKNSTNKTERLCNQPVVSKYFDENPSLNQKHECYEYGDHADFIHSQYQRSHISIIPPDEVTTGPRKCYFNITLHNASQTQPQYFDTACVEYGNEEHEILSKNRLWKVKKRKYERFKYNVEATRGEMMYDSIIEIRSIEKYRF